MNSLEQIKGGLVVSCQALKDEPLHSPTIMARMAYAAMLGGAKGIRANSTSDILEIKKVVDLPVIGIIKQEYPESLVYITPTIDEVAKLVDCGCEIIAMDATNRRRPNKETLTSFFKEVRRRYPHQLFMADCATYEEGKQAAGLGFDVIGTTLNGYTADTANDPKPNFQLLSELVRSSGRPVIAEGGFWTPQQLKQAKECGIHAAVVGSAITRPMEITKRFVEAMK